MSIELLHISKSFGSYQALRDVSLAINDGELVALLGPFGALDAKVRQGLRAWLRRLHDEIQVTSILVTHDQEEALEVADRVVVMNKGQIQQIGTPEEVFHKPATQFVMEFLGQVNVFHGRVQGGKAMLGEVLLDGHYCPDR